MHGDIISAHQRIAFQFSGGKDSLAGLHMLREHWDKMTVYWLDTGDGFPEVREVVDRVAGLVPRFVRIESSAQRVIQDHGLPTDLVPASCTPMGIEATGGGTLLQDRYSCCLRTLMIPMHQRMLDDGITLIIRGQKNSDKHKSTLRSGDVEGGVQYLFPVQDWDDARVMEYLRAHEIAYPKLYDEGLTTAPECMTCSGWWEDGRASYMREHHPIQFMEYQRKLNTISDAVSHHIAQFNAEVQRGH